MESVSQQLARPLPSLRGWKGSAYRDTTFGPPLSASFMHEWTTFLPEVQDTIAQLDLSGLISPTDDPEGELYLVGNQQGVQGRFMKNVIDSLNKAFGTIQHLIGLRFGDVHAADTVLDLPAGAKFPDAVLLKTVGTSKVVFVGEYKAPWAIPSLSDDDTSLPIISVDLERPIGQVVSYMRHWKLRYGFLSTYNATIFVRRDANYKFLLSPPIQHDRQGPSVRQCFLALAQMIVDARRFTEVDVDTRILSSGLESMQASAQPSHQTVDTPPQGQSSESPLNIGLTSVTPNTIFAGDHVARMVFESSDLTSGSVSKGKAVFNGFAEETPVVIKWWQAEFFDSYDSECSVYESLSDISPYPKNFAEVVANGNVICSGRLPGGYVMALKPVPGTPLYRIWDDLGDSTKKLVKDQVDEAIRVLRSIERYHRDAGQHNVLFSPETETVTLVDFEDAGYTFVLGGLGLDIPEKRAIFGCSGNKETAKSDDGLEEEEEEEGLIEGTGV